MACLAVSQSSSASPVSDPFQSYTMQRTFSLHFGPPRTSSDHSLPQRLILRYNDECKFVFQKRNFSTKQTQFFDELGKDLGVKEFDDWYKVLSYETLKKKPGGSAILAKYNSSAINALTKTYPEHNWENWKFNFVNLGFWKSKDNQKKFFDYLREQLGIQTLDDWYTKLSFKTVQQHGGSGLLRYYKNSPQALLMAMHPEHDWIPWKFEMVPFGFWKSLDNQRKFFDWLGNQIGIQHIDDWYDKLNTDLVEKYGGRGLLMQYKGSAVSALSAVYNHKIWVPWKFKCAPRSYWRDTSNIRRFFDDLGKSLGVQTMDDWYHKLSYDAITQHGGNGLLKIPQVNNCVVEALMLAYPDHNWIAWKFTVTPKGTWKSQKNVRLFLAELSEKLSIQTLEDWYRVDTRQLQALGARTLLLKYKGLYNMLKDQYPDYPWDHKRFIETPKKAQRWLAVTLKKIFPNEEILEDYMHPEAVFPSSKRPMQLDVFIPSRSLAFEYQGIQHYEEVGIFAATKNYQNRDKEKREICAAKNIQLIEVPYWWNRTQESLQEMIQLAK